MEEITSTQLSMEKESKTKKCPYCYSDIPIEATYCKYCRQKVEETNGKETSGVSPKLLLGLFFVCLAIFLFVALSTGLFDDITGFALELLLGLVSLIIGAVLIVKR